MPPDIVNSLLAVPGVKRVDAQNVLHVEITVEATTPELRKAIYEAEQKLIEAHPEIVFDFECPLRES